MPGMPLRWATSWLSCPVGHLPVSDGGAKIYSPVSIASNLIPSLSKNTVYAASKTDPVNSAPHVSSNCKSDKKAHKDIPPPWDHEDAAELHQVPHDKFKNGGAPMRFR